jgi:hypothetical protein
MIPEPKRVVALWQASQERVKNSSRGKTAGEVRFVKDRSGDAGAWGWGSPGPSERTIQEEFVFNAKYLKPLAKSMRSALMSMGHVVSAYNTFAKIKSRNISPDGSLGGKGYIQKIPDMRRQLMNCVEALSAYTDTVYDELNAPHWNPAEDTLDARSREEVKEIVQEAEEIKEDPEAWAEGEEEDDEGEDLQDSETPVEESGETLVDFRGKTAASGKTKALWVQEHLASTHMHNIQLNIKSISDFIDAFRESTQRIEEEGDFEDPRYLGQLVWEATGIEKATRQLNAVVEEAEKNIRDATAFRSGRFASSNSVAARYMEKNRV